MKNESAAITKPQIISELTRSTHGDLSSYVKVGERAALEEPEFFAHLIAWNQIKGQIRDSKVALPVVALTGTRDSELRENALAHLAKLDPRNLARAVRFAKSLRSLNGSKGAVVALVERYLRARESKWPWWERTALSHRAAMKELYALNHLKPSAMANAILFDGEYPAGTVFDVVKRLPSMSDAEKATAILENNLPMLVVLGAVGGKSNSEDLLSAMLKGMTPTQVVTHAAHLERLGVRSTPALRSLFEEKMAQVVSSKANTLKTGKAAKAVKDKKLAERIGAAQEKQINTLGGIEGDWLILADRSGSMSQAIELAKEVAAFLSRASKGIVSLVFFDIIPNHFDVTGKSLEEIKEATRHVRPGGSTSIGCGLRYAIEKNLPFGGIVVISDGGENAPPYFYSVYNAMKSDTGTEPPIYFYRTRGDNDSFSWNCSNVRIEIQSFDLTGGIDYYALPNLMQTMRISRYSLVDEIMATPLLSISDALGSGDAA